MLVGGGNNRLIPLLRIVYALAFAALSVNGNDFRELQVVQVQIGGCKIFFRAVDDDEHLFRFLLIQIGVHAGVVCDDKLRRAFTQKAF